MYFNDSEEREPEIEESGEASTYLSIGDLMSGLLMFFALLFITALLQLQQIKDQMNKEQQFFVGTLINKLNGNNLKVQVNPKTGDVSLRNEILFAEGSYELKPEGKKWLQKFVPVYSELIFSKPEFQRLITRVVLEGHTSSKGSYESNMELSLLRSLSVYKYIFSDEINFSTKSLLREKLLASGRGEFDSEQKKDNADDRKVVFRFQFKNDQLSEKNQSILPQK
jgi:hypothetical protein